MRLNFRAGPQAGFTLDGVASVLQDVFRIAVTGNMKVKELKEKIAKELECRVRI